MQVIVLDRHAPADARIDRHCDTLLRNGVRAVRIRMCRPGENSDCKERLLRIGRTIELVPLNRLPFPLQIISQQVMYLFPTLMHRIYPFHTLMEMDAKEETIIHVHDPNMLGMAKQLKRKHFPVAKIVYDRHEVFEEAGGPYGFVSTVFENINAHHVQAVVGVSPVYEKPNEKIFPCARVTSVPNYPLCTEYDHPAIKDKIDCFDRDSEILLSYIGSLNHHYDRDMFLLLELLEQALERVPKVRAYIGGRTESKELLHRLTGLIEKYGDRFQYPGYVSRPEARRISERSHLGFLLLKRESKYQIRTSPNKFFEYLTTGNVAVVRGDIDAELPPDSAMIYDYGTADQKIIDDVLTLLEDPERIKRMMQSAYRQGSRFIYENVESNYLELYRSLCDEK